MKRYQFDRIIRSFAQITGKPDVLVIGSQAIVGVYGDIDDAAIVESADLDVSPMDNDDSHLHEIAGVLGELSLFQDSNDGAYADSVMAEEVAVLPPGWRERLIKVETPNMITPGRMQARAFCLHPNDVIVSKLFAGREKDYQFCDALLRHEFPEIDCNEIEVSIRAIMEQSQERKALGEIALARVAAHRRESVRGRSGRS